jgi:hypothetical protein
MPSNTFSFSGLLALISLKSCRHIYYVNQTNLSIHGIKLSLDLPRWHKRKYMRSSWKKVQGMLVRMGCQQEKFSTAKNIKKCLPDRKQMH